MKTSILLSLRIFYAGFLTASLGCVALRGQTVDLLQDVDVRPTARYAYYARGNATGQAITPFTKVFYPGGSDTGRGLHGNDVGGPYGRDGGLVDSGANAGWIPAGQGELTDGVQAGTVGASMVSGWIDVIDTQSTGAGATTGRFDVLFDLGAIYRVSKVVLWYRDLAGYRWSTMLDAQEVWTAASLAQGSVPAESDFARLASGTATGNTSGMIELTGRTAAYARYVNLRLTVTAANAPGSTASMGGVLYEVQIFGDKSPTMPINLLEDSAVREMSRYAYFSRGNAAGQAITSFSKLFYPGGSDSGRGLHGNDVGGPYGRDGGLVDSGVNAGWIQTGEGELTDGVQTGTAGESMVSGWINVLDPVSAGSGAITGRFDVLFDLGGVYRVSKVVLWYRDLAGYRWSATTDAQEVWTAISSAQESGPVASDFTRFASGTAVGNQGGSLAFNGDAELVRYVNLRLAVTAATAPGTTASMGGILYEVQIFGERSTGLEIDAQTQTVTSLTNLITGESYSLEGGCSRLVAGAEVLDANGASVVAPAGTVALTMTAQAGANGVDVTQTAISQNTGITRSTLLVGPLDRSKVTLLVPGYNGIGFTPADVLPRQNFYYPGDSWHTPMVILQGERGGIMIYADDPSHRFVYLATAQNTSGGMELGLTTYSEHPVASQSQVVSPSWTFHAYEGHWTVAAAKMRQVLANRYGLEPLSQTTPGWTKDIKCVVKLQGSQSWDADLTVLAQNVNPAHTLIYIPEWRTNGFDVGYPDYTASSRALSAIQTAHTLGFKVMVHVNFTGVSPLHPDWSQWSSYAQRKDDGSLYGWNIDEPTSAQIACLDPAYPEVRSYFVGLFSSLHSQYGFDALHLDYPIMQNCPRVSGVNTIEGAAIYLHALRAAMPDVALSTESLRDNLSICSLAQIGALLLNEDESRGPMHPVYAAVALPFTTSYGHIGMPDQHNHVSFLRYQNLHDRYGVLPTFRLNSNTGFNPLEPGNVFALGLANAFIDNQLVPDLGSLADMDAARWQNPGQVWFQWKSALTDRSAVMATYSFGHALTIEAISGGVSTLSQPYRVFSGVNSLATIQDNLGRIPNWPAYNASGFFGLSPDEVYASILGNPDQSAFHLYSASLPVVVERGGGNSVRDTISVTSLNGATTPLNMACVQPAGVAWTIVRDAVSSTGTMGALTSISNKIAPVAVYYAKSQPRVVSALPTSLIGMNFTKNIMIQGCLSEGSVSGSGNAGTWDGRPGYSGRTPTDGETHLEWFVQLPSAVSRFRCAVRVNSSGGGGEVGFRVEINGRSHWSFVNTVPDAWSEVDVDMSDFKGQPVFITLVTDSRGSSSGDSAVWAEPRLEAF